MNRLDHLLVILMEEAAEVQQAAAKALRFGLYDGYPNSASTNEQDLKKELNQLIATVQKIRDEGIDLDGCFHQRLEKREKIEHWLEYSKELGRLE